MGGTAFVCGPGENPQDIDDWDWDSRVHVDYRYSGFTAFKVVVLRATIAFLTAVSAKQISKKMLLETGLAAPEDVEGVDEVVVVANYRARVDSALSLLQTWYRTKPPTRPKASFLDFMFRGDTRFAPAAAQMDKHFETQRMITEIMDAIPIDFKKINPDDLEPEDVETPRALTELHLTGIHTLILFPDSNGTVSYVQAKEVERLLLLVRPYCEWDDTWAGPPPPPTYHPPPPVRARSPAVINDDANGDSGKDDGGDEDEEGNGDEDEEENEVVDAEPHFIDQFIHLFESTEYRVTGQVHSPSSCAPYNFKSFSPSVQVSVDAKSAHFHPELRWDLSPPEAAYLPLRLMLMTGPRRNDELLSTFLRLEDEEVVLAEVSIVGSVQSGSGMRYGAVCEKMKQVGMWDLITYFAGVSESCWAICSYYTWERGIGKRSWITTATQNHHPLSKTAVRWQVPELKRARFYWSRVWKLIENGDAEPLPILTDTSVRGKTKRTRSVFRHRQQRLACAPASPGCLVAVVRDHADAKLAATSLKAESQPGLSAAVGLAVQRLPEQSLSLLLRLTTSAPAGLLKGLLSSYLGTHLPRPPDRRRDFASNEPNPFFRAFKEVGRGQGTENRPRAHLINSDASTCVVLCPLHRAR
ncbi:hypothetical protein GGX14DRAFT_633436 [Mycena pura]|uniref:Uncharacterized protein n=1 Tax=Mycena pura TaxID=153505 RepID=A0AAD6YEB3_9AGAR|nr:hypothetical protein GGX14DRAFT_633436 [Mycena pura]